MITATSQSAAPACNSSAIVEAMMRPEMYPDHPHSVEVRQTHVSYAFSDKRVAVQGRGAWLKSAALQKAKKAWTNVRRRPTVMLLASAFQAITTDKNGRHSSSLSNS
jgi:hypothetical protein